MSFLGSIFKAIPIVGQVVDAIDGSNHAKSQSTATAHAGSTAQLASNQAQALMAGATPIRQAAEAALLARLKAGPGFGVSIPNLQGVVDNRNPFRKNYAMPLAPPPAAPMAPPPLASVLMPPAAPPMPLPASAGMTPPGSGVTKIPNRIKQLIPNVPSSPGDHPY